MYKSFAITWMKLALVAIALLFLGLISRELWAVYTHSMGPSLQAKDQYCGVPFFTGINWQMHILQILLACISLLPIAFTPWLISRLIPLIPKPSKHQLSEFWWAIRGRRG